MKTPIHYVHPSRLNREILVVWSFVFLSFAVFIFAGYVLWAKCRGQ